MTMVWGDPAGFAVDWNWQRGQRKRQAARVVISDEAPAAVVRKVSASGGGQAGLATMQGRPLARQGGGAS